ncbi:MAG TPA: hypothetical protein VEV13_06345 [Candidatus Limnocylindria bacterium]|nr:hypothetical protein [Candidatus Limnocylindria bacterium]
MKRPAVVLGAALALVLTGAPVALASPHGDEGSWRVVNPSAPWAARAGLQAVELGRSIYVMGGRTPTDPSLLPFPIPGAGTIWSDVWRSDNQGHTWTQVAQSDDSHWPARAYFQAVTKGGAMYVLGGQNFKVGVCQPPAPGAPAPPSCSDFFNDVWKSRDGKHWKQQTAHAGWAGRAGLSAAVLNDEIYVFGGSVNDDSAVVGGPPVREYFNDVWKSRDGKHWKQVSAAAPWEARAGAAVVVKGGWIYLLGGEKGFTCASAGPPPPGPPAACQPGDPAYPYFNDVWRTRDGRHWQKLTTSAGWSPRPGHQCALLKRDIVCFGGFGQPTNPMDMWASRNGRTWRLLPSAPWDATSPSEVKYDFDALSVSGGRYGCRPGILTFGGDRETFDFGDPDNWKRVDNDVWRYTS